MNPKLINFNIMNLQKQEISAKKINFNVEELEERLEFCSCPSGTTPFSRGDNWVECQSLSPWYSPKLAETYICIDG